MAKTNKKPILAGQLSTVHSSEDVLQVDKVERYLGRITGIVSLDILIMGWNEKPDLFNRLTHTEHRPSKQVFLWYPFLSDYPEFDNKHLVVNLDGEASKGWAGYAGTGINESFQQACPNNPYAVSTSLRHLERLMDVYAFDGAFIDKIRFPSPANGFSELFTCFCIHCIDRAAQYDIDLAEVRHVLRNVKKLMNGKNLPLIPESQNWLEDLVANQPILQRFIHFRMDSINRLLLEIDTLLKRKNKILALDVFSPSLAPLVGQDFGFMATLAAWIKPMIYRFGQGPSSLRSEFPALIYGLSDYLALEPAEVVRFFTASINGLQSIPIAEIAKMAPISLIQAETDLAIRQLAGAQVYLGLESVYIPQKMEIKPQHIKEILKIGAQSRVDGYVLSWDLLHTPINNLMPLKTLF